MDGSGANEEGFLLHEMVRPAVGKFLIKDDAEGGGEGGEFLGAIGVFEVNLAEEFERLWLVVVLGKREEEKVSDYIVGAYFLEDLLGVFRFEEGVVGPTFREEGEPF